MIETYDITKLFNGVAAVDHVNLEVKTGEIFGFIGPNGSGKTTTTRMLATVLRPTEGEARVGGYDLVNDSLKVKKLMAYAPQLPSLNYLLPIFDQIVYYLRLREIDSTESKRLAHEAIECFNLEPYADKKPIQLSPGLIRKVILARTFSYRPPLIFLDEPTAGLDPKSRREILNYIRKIRKEENLTIFLTTNILNDAEDLCDTICFINKGKIVRCGSISKFKSEIKRTIIDLGLDGNEKSIQELKNKIEVLNFLDILKFEPPSLLINLRDRDKFSELFEVIRYNNIKIRWVRMSEPTIEDVYLEVIK
jgi:ABC-2 type transport system ATP-binding protein